MTVKKETPMKALRNIALAAGLALGLSGCISFGPDAPESLLTLTPTSTISAGTTGSITPASAIRIMEPEAPQRLNVTRIPVQIDDTEIAYLENATWVEKPTRLFRRLLAETVRARTGRSVVDSDDPALLVGAQLRGTMRDFGYDVPSSSVVVRFDAVRTNADGQVQTKRFESIQPGIAAESAPVGAALNRAANDVAVQVSDWIAG